MRRIVFRSLQVVLISAVIIGCSRELIVEKRRYRPGWHIALKGATEKIKRDVAATDDLVVTEPAVDRQTEAQPAATPERIHEPIVAKSEPVVRASGEEKADVKVERLEKNPIAQKDVTAASVVAPEKVKPSPEKKSEPFPFMPVMLGGALALGGLVSARPARFRRVAEWARNHKEASRSILTAAHLGLGFGAFYTGHQAGLDGYSVSQSWITGSALAFFLALVFYPIRSMKGLFGGGFIRRKWHDLVLTASGVMLLFGSASTIPQREEPVNPVSGAIVSVLLPDHVYAGDAAQYQEPEEYNADEKGFVKFLLSLLTVVVFLFAWAVVISLACNLSCSGNEAAAAFVGIAGTLILLILLILVMRRIWSKKFNQPDPQPAPAAPSE
jgi:hypothetical protein